MSDGRTTSNRVQQCRYWIEKDWPGHTVALSRRQCKNRTAHPSGYCHMHVYMRRYGDA